MPNRLSFVASLVFALLAGTAAAEEVRLYRPSETVDPGDVAAILGADKPRIKMRSIRLLDDKGASAAQQTTEAAAPSSLAVPVQFGFDSSDIQPAARPQLDAIAEGIRQLDPTRQVVIEGHT